ncbi:MAG: hypothetical protein GY856_07310 [bacterium]|nr:hypothetical protein [bacterium]
MRTETLARWEARLRPFLARLPPALAVRVYSRGRRSFLRSFARRPPAGSFQPEGWERTLWGLSFRSPIFNAAGMFKNGDGYEVVARQGAGAYLAGTTTHRRRMGNRRHGVALPFAPYPRSHAAGNWLGLPNLGHRAVAAKLRELPRRQGCPVGVSVAAEPEPAIAEQDKLEQLAAGMRLYEESGVDFIELNESCPNTAEDVCELDRLRLRLAYLRDAFLTRRRRMLPVVVKFSCDTEPTQLPLVLAMLVELGFDGVNFGNTSTAYDEHRVSLASAETALYDYFTRAYGGGLSGRPLRQASLRLAAGAVEHLRGEPPCREFHVMRTGGIGAAEDVARSAAAGVALNQWYTGYFEAFARDGHDLYRRLCRELGQGVARARAWGSSTER